MNKMSTTFRRMSMEEAVRLLHQTGLLFEINRRILHPHGLSIEAFGDKASVLYTSEVEGWRFPDEVYAEGARKYQEFMDAEQDRLSARMVRLGYVEQPPPDGVGEDEAT